MRVLLERKKEIDICNISATALCGNFKPDPYLQGNKEEKRRVIRMRIKLGNKIYKMRKEAELVWDLVLCAILACSFFPMVRVFAHIIVFIAKEVMHYGI